MISVKIKNKGKFDVPQYQSDGAAGCDVTSIENSSIPVGGFNLISTGIFLEIPRGFECQIRPRSGLAFKHGITVLNSPGTIDSDYRGEVKVLLYNAGPNRYEVKKGDRIAQLVFAPVVQVAFDIVDELVNSNRGSSGFGSTG